MKTLKIAITVLSLVLSGCASMINPSPQHIDAADHGSPPPSDYEDQVTRIIKGQLKDPESATFEFEPLKYAGIGRLYHATKYGYGVKVWVNAKNSYGGYTGRQPWLIFYVNGVVDLVQTPQSIGY
jgi:hypothetical protein